MSGRFRKSDSTFLKENGFELEWLEWRKKFWLVIFNQSAEKKPLQRLPRTFSNISGGAFSWKFLMAKNCWIIFEKVDVSEVLSTPCFVIIKKSEISLFKQVHRNKKLVKLPCVAIFSITLIMIIFYELLVNFLILILLIW